MATKNPRVDDYIAKSADFAKPILNHLRRLVHQACPDVTEAIKWQHISLEYKGMFCMVAAFKQHCTFGFWKRALIFREGNPFGKSSDEAMAGCDRITSVTSLPPDDVLLGYLREAIRLNDEGIKAMKPKSKEKKELIVPPYFIAALKKNKKALAAFEKFSYSHKKEYVEWITDAKTEATRDRRIATALEWLAEGKSRNWKYANC